MGSLNRLETLTQIRCRDNAQANPFAQEMGTAFGGRAQEASDLVPRSAKSVSFLRASRWLCRVARGLGFFQSAFSSSGSTARSRGRPGRLLTLDDISQGGDAEAGVFRNRTSVARFAETFERRGMPVDCGHEIEVAGHPASRAMRNRPLTG